METLYKGWQPKWAELEKELTVLGFEFARKFLKDMAASVKDGYKTTKEMV